MASGGTVERLSVEISDAAMELAREVVDEGLRDDAVPSLQRLDERARLGDMPVFIVELARQASDPEPARLRRGSPLAALARDHAREREALGFAPREIVTELLLLRRVLWRFVALRSAELDAGEVFVLEQRLNDTLDRLVTESVVAYFDQATSELAHRAHHDPLTQLLDHQAFFDELEAELERAGRYRHAVALVYFDIDRFKTINDTLGHPEGDRVLRLVAALLRQTLRRSDLAGRMGGDEFAATLVESEDDAAAAFLARLDGLVREGMARGELPSAFAISHGVASFPGEASDAAGLFRLADERLYALKRSRA